MGILQEEVVAGTIFYHIEEDNPIVRHLRILSNVTNIYEISKGLRRTRNYTYSALPPGAKILTTTA